MLKCHKPALCCLFIFLQIPSEVLGVVSSMGKLFVVALPKIMKSEYGQQTSLYFELTTLYDEQFSVSIETPFFAQDQSPLTESVSVSRLEPTEFSVGNKYKSDVEMGHKWTYSFQAEFGFSVCAHYTDQSTLAATFRLLPVTLWGTRYFTVNLDRKPTIQIISSGAHNMISTVVHLQKATFELMYNGAVYSNKNLLQFTLNKYEAFDLSVCPDDKAKPDVGSMTGTKISSRLPVGVVTGNCATETKTVRCDNASVSVLASKKLDATAEMLFPVKYFGREFILITLPNRLVQGMIIILSSTDRQQVQVNISVGNQGEVRTVYVGVQANLSLEVLDDALIKSESPIQIMYVQRAACVGRPNEVYGDATFSLLIPTAYFYVSYAWSTPTFAYINYIAIITDIIYTRSLDMDGHNLPLSIHWKDVRGSDVYLVGHTSTPPGYHILHSLRLSKFGCYIYGYTEKTGYMHVAGFQDCRQNESKDLQDGVDNDCDGRIDEEIENKRDDDNDGRIDEDSRYPPPGFVPGGWSSWASWECNKNCSNRILYRTRECNNPPPSEDGAACLGECTEYSKESCKADIFCPQDCKEYHWGPQCAFSCSNCAVDCNKVNGSCAHCTSGYKNSYEGCTKACEANEWGVNCAHNCHHKCAADCTDRVTGACPRDYKFLLLIPIVLLGVGITVCVRIKLKQTEESAGPVSFSIEAYPRPTECAPEAAPWQPPEQRAPEAHFRGQAVETEDGTLVW